MKVLLTGGAGFVGSHVAQALLTQGDEVVIIDDLNDYYDPALKQGNLAEVMKTGPMTFYQLDIRDAKLDEVFAQHKPDAVIHIAARAGVRYSLLHPQLYIDVNINGTANLLELAVKHSVSTFVFASSSSVYGENSKVPFAEEDSLEHMISPYALTKRLGELLCQTFARGQGLHITCLRFFTVYGPRGRPDMAPRKFTKSIMEGTPLDMYGDGTSQRDYTYVTDIAAGVLAALDKRLPFEIINLGNNNPIELRRFIALIEQDVGKNAVIVQKSMQQGDVPVTYADITKAKKLLDWEPTVRIEEGIKLLVAWHKEQARKQ